MKSRRFKKIAVVVLCVASVVRGGYDLERGAPFGIEMATLALVWAIAYGWLTGRWLPSRVRRAALVLHGDRSAPPPGPPRPDTALESVLSWGLWAWFLALVVWIASGVWA